MKCKKCQIDFPENEIHEHHIQPRFMNNSKGNGIKIYLCKKCHDILHQIIPSIIWKYVSPENEEKCIKNVISFSERYIHKEGKKDGNRNT